MPNYNLVLDTKFKPFSYQEMLAPVLAATQAHQAIEDAYGELADKANIWENMVDKQRDKYAYSLYKAYSDDLSNKAEQLMRNGLDPTSRQQMLKMKSRFSSDIAPIEVAYKKREALAEEQRKAISANPTLLYQRMANTLSLDDFLRNPSLDYGEVYSGALLRDQVSKAAGNLAKEARDSKEARRTLRSLLLPFQYEIVEQSGFSRDAVLAAISNSPNADTVLTNLVEGAIQSSGIGKLDSQGNIVGEGWGDLATRRRAYDYARQGLWDAIGETKYTNITDQYNMQLASEKAKEERARKQVEKDTKEQMRESVPINPSALRSQQQVSEAAQYSKFFTIGKNGHLALTTEGKKEYFKPDNTYTERDPIYGNEYTRGYVNKFRRFVDKIGGKQFIYKNIKGEQDLQPGNIGLLYQKYMDNKQYDTYHATEFPIALDETQGTQLLLNAKPYAPNGKFKVVDYQDGQMKVMDEIDIDDCKNKRITHIMPGSSRGQTFITGFLQNKDGSGEVQRVLIPSGINTTAETRTNTATLEARDYQEVLNKGKRPVFIENRDGSISIKKDSNGNIMYTKQDLTPEDSINLDNLQKDALVDMNKNVMQLLLQSKIKGFEYTPMTLFNYGK